MIRAERSAVQRPGQGLWRCALRVDGHAPGQPEVCAAVSILVQSLRAHLRLICPGGEVRARVERGRARLIWEGGEAVALAFRQTAVGLRQVALAHPEAVEIADGTAGASARSGVPGRNRQAAGLRQTHTPLV